MWDQLTPTDFQRGRHVLNLRRADTLRRHAAEFMQLQAKQAAEIKALDEKYAQIDALEALVENLAHQLTPDRDTVVRAYANSLAVLKTQGRR
jgi:hypothetical protein